MDPATKTPSAVMSKNMETSRPKLIVDTTTGHGLRKKIENTRLKGYYQDSISGSENDHSERSGLNTKLTGILKKVKGLLDVQNSTCVLNVRHFY